MNDLTQLDSVPATYQALTEFFAKSDGIDPFALRRETFLRIEKLTDRPLVCYVAKTHNVASNIPAYIDHSDVTGFADLISTSEGPSVDVFLVSNGGSPEATERIVRLMRGRFESVRFIIPANAFSAATLMCFSGDAIIMDGMSTLGPIDPQLNGIPARAIRRAFETIEKRLVEEGPRALPAYLPLISKYDLHILEICKSAEDLSKELAATWLSMYMLKCEEDDPKIAAAVEFFAKLRHTQEPRAQHRSCESSFALAQNPNGR